MQFTFSDENISRDTLVLFKHDHISGMLSHIQIQISNSSGGELEPICGIQGTGFEDLLESEDLASKADLLHMTVVINRVSHTCHFSLRSDLEIFRALIDILKNTFEFAIFWQTDAECFFRNMGMTKTLSAIGLFKMSYIKESGGIFPRLPTEQNIINFVISISKGPIDSQALVYWNNVLPLTLRGIVEMALNIKKLSMRDVMFREVASERNFMVRNRHLQNDLRNKRIAMGGKETRLEIIPDCPSDEEYDEPLTCVGLIEVKDYAIFLLRNGYEERTRRDSLLDAELDQLNLALVLGGKMTNSRMLVIDYGSGDKIANKGVAMEVLFLVGIIMTARRKSTVNTAIDFSMMNPEYRKYVDHLIKRPDDLVGVLGSEEFSKRINSFIIKKGLSAKNNRGYTFDIVERAQSINFDVEFVVVNPEEGYLVDFVRPEYMNMDRKMLVMVHERQKVVGLFL